MYALILAGGIGSRLWPKSRIATPKQFLDLTGSETMLQIAVGRIEPAIPLERIFVITGQRYVSMVQEQVPSLPPENIIAEPSGKNTAPAIALGALHIAARDPQATMAVLTADHLIPHQAKFRQVVLAAGSVAEAGHLVTLGIQPTGPETGYGYIRRGQNLGQFDQQTAYAVQEFLEKPNLEKAEHFYQSGEYYWNAGMFIWQLDIFFAQLAEYMPQLTKKLALLKASLFETASGEPDAAVFGEVWQSVQPESIDIGLMEQATDVAVVPLQAGWNDVGSWAALYDELAATEGANVAVNAQHLAFDSQGVLVQGTGKLVATIGLQDVVIVETDDALLVCARDQTQKVKQVVSHLKEKKAQQYL